MIEAQGRPRPGRGARPEPPARPLARPRPPPRAQEAGKWLRRLRLHRRSGGRSPDRDRPRARARSRQV